MSSPAAHSAVARTFPEVQAAQSAVDATTPVTATSASIASAPSPSHKMNDNYTSSSSGSGASVQELEHVNRKLRQSVELLQGAIVRLGDDSKQQLETMSGQLEELLAVNQRTRRENEDLKARVADDVLRQRQTNRIEMAVERAKVASHVRLAGRQRLESMEAVLMEAHDDLFHVQRFDAALAPQREVSFVFHYVSNVVFPLAGAEQFVMNVYQQILRSTAQRLRGYTVSSCMGMDVFAFQSATTALEFAKDCHEQVVRLGWPEQTERVPFFATVAEFGYVLFRGPRIHTAIFTCDPETEVNAGTGRTIYFGADVKRAVDAALSVSAVGEIAVNERCSDVLTREHRVVTDGAEPKPADAVDALRQSLGKNWDVVRLPNTFNMVASLLPLSLKGRRGVQVGQLVPTPKYPAMDGIDPQATALAVVKTLKGQKVDVVEMHGGRKRVARFVESNAEPDNTVYDSAAKLLEFYTMQRERDNVIALYRRTEQSAAALERVMMESEDRYEVSRRKPLDPSETAFVCTVDTGDETVWDKVLSSSSMQGERDQVQSQVRGAVHTFARQYYGFLMNGNYVDVFTYVFREVEQALAFVSGVYIQINRLGTKLTGQEVYLMRAGISCGPMSTIYRNMEDGLLKCTGPVIRLSATLSDLAQNGEILAMEDVIQEFHKKNENLLDTQYNMVRQQSRFTGVYDTPSIVHSILPRPFAFRRQQLMNSAAAPASSRPRAGRSAKAVLAVRQKQFARRDVEKLLSDQLERLERIEASRMATEDAYEESTATLAAVVRNPWLFTSQPQVELVRRPRPGEEEGEDGRRLSIAPPPSALMGPGLDVTETTLSRRGVGLGFLFSDVVGSAWIARELAEDVLQEVYQHYNRIVQDILRECGAYVVKTSAVTGYVAAFYPPVMALEAAVRIQQRLLATTWPVELSTLEPTLFVKDARTGTVLFNGLRAQVAVHYSTHYKWKLLPPPPPSAAGTTTTATASTAGRRSSSSSASQRAVSASQRGASGTGKSDANSNSLVASRGGAKDARTRPTAGSARRRNGAGLASSIKSDYADGTAHSDVPEAPDKADLDSRLTYVEVSSTAMSELVYLGRLAHGGEIRMSLPLVDAIRRTTSGRLLLEQLTMRIVVPVTAPTAITCESRRPRSGEDEATTSSAARPRSNSTHRRTMGSVAGEDGVSTGGEVASSPLGESVQAEGPRRRSRSPSFAPSATGSHTGRSAVPASSSSSANATTTNEVVVSRWIVAVLRSLEGRFQFLLPTAEARATSSGGGGSSANANASPSAATTTAAAAAATAAGGGAANASTGPTSTASNKAPAESGNPSASKSGDARADKAHSRGQRARSSSVSSTRDRRQSSTSPGPHQAHHQARDMPWFLQSESCTLPLPAASRGYWDQPLIVSRSGHPEAETIQNALAYVLALFPSDLQDSQIIRRLAAANAPTSSSATTAAQPSAAMAASTGDKLRSPLTPVGGLASSTGGSTRTSPLPARALAATPGSGTSPATIALDATLTDPAAVQERKRRTDAARHYVHWMRVARHVLDCVLSGFRTGNDGLKLSKTRKGGTVSPRGPALGLETLAETGEEGEDGMPRQTSESDFTPDGSAFFAASLSLSATTPPNETQLASTTHSTTTTAGTGIAVPLVPQPPALTGLSVLRSRTADGNSQDNYWRALDGLDDACRSLSEDVGRALGKVVSAPPAVPQAPKNIAAKKGMAASRRRF